MKKKHHIILVASVFAMNSCGPSQPSKMANIISTDSLSRYIPEKSSYSKKSFIASDKALESAMHKLSNDFHRQSKDTTEIMIFVHGGLTGQDAGINGATEKINEIIKHNEKSKNKIYPIFITWESGLILSYFSHTTYDLNGIGTSSQLNGLGIYYIPADLLHGIASLPKTYFISAKNQTSDLYARNIKNPSNTIKSILIDNPSQQYCKTMNILDSNWSPKTGGYHPPGKSGVPYEIKLGKDTFNGESEASSLTSALFFYSTWLLSFPYESIGKPAWENMQKRAKTLVYRYPTMIDYGSINGRKADGVLPCVLREVQSWQSENTNLKVTFVGHSMGTIVLNEAFRAINDKDQKKDPLTKLRVDKIIYLAAACNIRDFNDSVGYYMKSNPNCETYALCLHPTREKGEKFMPYLPLVFSGSLLRWIDDFFESPRDFNQRTFGSFVNCIVAYKHLPQTSKFHLKTFDSNESYWNKILDKNNPQKHGEMDNGEFWNPNFYQPISYSKPKN